MIKRFWLVALFAAFFLMAGAARADKSYRISFNQPVTLGAVPVEAGEYDLVIDQSQVRLRDVGTGKSMDLKAQVVVTETKYGHTSVLSNRANGKNEVKEIQLGGAKIRVVFEAEPGANP